MFLQALHDHENIIKLQKVIKADNDRDIYLVFEHMGTSFTSAPARTFTILRGRL